MKCIENVKGESALWSCDGRQEAAEPEELNMTHSASRHIVASTELNVDSVDTRLVLLQLQSAPFQLNSDSQ